MPTTTVTIMARGTAITMVDRMGITTVARDTIAATIATTTVGKEEPGAIRAFSLPGKRAGNAPGEEGVPRDCFTF